MCRGPAEQEKAMKDNVKGSTKIPLIVILSISFIYLGLMVLMMTAGKQDTAADGPFTMSYVHDGDGPAGEKPFLTVKASSPHGVTAVNVNLKKEDGVKVIEGIRVGDTNWWAAELPTDEIGVRSYFYIKAYDGAGNELVLPESAGNESAGKYSYYKYRHEGKPWFWALWLHVLLMVIAILFFIHAVYFALVTVMGDENRFKELVCSTHAGVLAFFITGFPLGWIIEKQVLGNYWEGIPFGWDITDSKTLFIFIFWLIPLFIRRKSPRKTRKFAWAVLSAGVFTILMYMIPHSL